MLRTCDILIQSELQICQTYPSGVGRQVCSLLWIKRLRVSGVYNRRFQVKQGEKYDLQIK